MKINNRKGSEGCLLDDLRPRIDVLGETFIVAWEARKLLAAENTSGPGIVLFNLPLTEDGKSYQCIYDPVNKKSLDIICARKGLPKGAVVIEIPNELTLDPKSVAREMGLNAAELLKVYPAGKVLKAKAILWEESRFPALLKKMNSLSIKKNKLR